MSPDGSHHVIHFRDPIGRSVVRLAQGEALALGHTYLGTEHLLIALTRCEGGYTARTLERLHLEPALLRDELRRRAGLGDHRLIAAHELDLKPTPRLGQALVAAQHVAAEEANAANALGADAAVGAGGADGAGERIELGERELLLAILRGGPGLALRVLAGHDQSPEALLEDLLRDHGPEATAVLLPAQMQGGRHERERESPQNRKGAREDMQDDDNEEQELPKRRGSAAPGASATPILDRYGRDLTALARAGELSEVIGRKEALAAIAQAFARQDRNVPVLVGEAGVGKTAIVEGLAARLAQEATRPVVAALRGKRIVELYFSNLFAGGKYQGDVEQRVRDLLRECAAHPEVILFLDEIHTLVGAGHSHDNQDAAQMLKPALARGELRIIGATTPAEYQRYIAHDSALERRMQPIPVEELSQADTEELLRTLAPDYERRYHVRLDPAALTTAVEYSVRYLPEQWLPAKALDLLNAACSAVVAPAVSVGVSSLGDLGAIPIPVPRDHAPAGAGPAVPPPTPGRPPKLVTPNVVAAALANRLQIPISQFTTSDQQRLLTLDLELRKRVVAQNEAIAAVARAVRVSRTILGDPDRPRGVFLFAGPTGVGKTETARALADTLFGGKKDQNLLTLDLAEFSQEHMIAQLIGSPPGYVDSDQDGRLTAWLRRHPYSVVLLDEVEKAHPAVRRLFLNLFDRGSLADAHGRLVNGREAIYIITTNLLAGAQAPAPSPADAEDGLDDAVRAGNAPAPNGADVVLAAGHPSAVDVAAATSELDGRLLREALAPHLSPELVNRIDHIIRFRPLDRAALAEIAQLQIDQLRARLDPRQVSLELDAAAQEWLVDRGFHSAFGARAVVRAIHDDLLNPLADLELRGKLLPGAQLTVTLRDGRLHVTMTS